MAVLGKLVPARDRENLFAIDLAGEAAVPVGQRSCAGQVNFHGGIAGQAGQPGQHTALRFHH